MSSPNRLFQRAWEVAALLALAFLVTTTVIRIRRVAYVTAVAGRSDAELAAPASRRPELIVPGHHNESFEWLDQTRQMFARHEARVRRIDYENAPYGREVFAMSPYRWWLGLLAGVNHLLSDEPMARAVERAALYADPLLLLLVAAATALFVAREWGPLAGAAVSLALATLFPWASAFLAGAPDDRGLALALGLWSLLLPLAGAGRSPGAQARWLAAAGAAGAAGLWVSAAGEAPLLAGLGVGALWSAWTQRGDPRAPRLPWRTWGVAGAVGCLAAYIVEFFPHHLGAWEFHVIHPLFGLAWLGAGDLLDRVAGRLQGQKLVRGAPDAAVAVLAGLAAASLPVAMAVTHSLGFLSVDLAAMRLSALPGAGSAPTLWAWLLQNGLTPGVAATLAPLLLVVPAVAFVFLPRVPAGLRARLALALGPVLAAVGFACRQISWWNGVDAALLTLLPMTAAAAAALPRPRLVLAAAAVTLAAALLLGATRLWPAERGGAGTPLSETEVVGLVERDLAHWLSQHIGPDDVVLAPPNITVALHYYADIRGLGTFGWENSDGLTAAIRMSSATTPEESQELFGRRGVRYIVIPSWDPYMDAYARMGAGELQGTFLERLYHWVLPAWLRPVPYLIPTIPGFEGQSVTVLEVVDEQDAATAASRLAEYFVAEGQMDLAVNAGSELRKFPADLGALLGRAEVAIAGGDAEESTRAVALLLRRISDGADRDLPWDERVALAIILAQTHHLDLAKARLAQTLAEVDDDKLRSLATADLYRLEVLERAVGLEIADPKLRETALALLPPDLRARVEK